MALAERAIPLDAVPHMLRWGEDDAPLEQVHEAWTTMVHDRLAELLHALEQLHPASAERVRAALASLDEGMVERMVEAPETTFRLFWGRDPAETGQFLFTAAAAERARAGKPVSVGRPVWSARGDFVVLPGGERVHGPAVAGVPCLDLDSPAACQLDLTGANYTVRSARRPLTGPERTITLARLEELSSELRAASPRVAAFVLRFTKVLILQRHGDEPFSSGSNGQFVGRSAVANPQLPSADGAVLADAVVHEAIHALLYMQELRRGWVLEASLYEATPRITSPWSGRRLPVRAFLQACFVWYGLVNFWAQAHLNGALNQRRKRDLFARAAGGFLDTPLVNALEPYRSVLRDEVLDAVAEMQADVVRCVGGET